MREGYGSSFGESEGYLNFASYGPPSRAAAAESARVFDLAVSGADSGTHLHSEDARAIAAVARLSGFGDSAIQLVPSTSHGLFQVAFGVPGGEVVVAPGEFPSNVYPWWRAEQAGRLRVRRMAGAHLDPVTPERVAAALTPATTAVSVSAVDFRTGWRVDLAGLREAIGDRLLVVDAIQGFGAVEMAWDAADAIVVGGQKWLRAGWGTGFVAFSDRALNQLTPVLGGWTGVEEPSRYDGLPHPLAPGARRFSITNGSPFASGALAAALELVETVGVASIESTIGDRVAQLLGALDAADISVVSPTDRRSRAGIVVAHFAAGAAGVHERLTSAGFTTTLHGPDRIRISVHATTTTTALDALATTLKGLS